MIRLAYKAWIVDTALPFLCSTPNRCKNGVSILSLVSSYLSETVVVYYQDQVIKRVKISIQNLGKTSSHQLLRRPFQVTWFSNQLAMYVITSDLFLTRLLIYLRDVHRCLLLWNQNHEWVNAITLAKSILIPLDVLNVLWPSPGMFLPSTRSIRS